MAINQKYNKQLVVIASLSTQLSVMRQIEITKKRGLFLFSTLIFLSACGPIEEIENRKNYWGNELCDFFETDRRLNELHPWLRERNVFYTFDQSEIEDGFWEVGLERIYTETWRCEWVSFRLKVTLDSSEEITSHTMEKKEACWI